MRKVYFLTLLFFSLWKGSSAQELFMLTDPASNIPANALAVNVMQMALKKNQALGYNYHILPEISYGVNKNWMIRTSAFLSDRKGALNAEGGSIFSKYRLFSIDDIKSHFRISAYGRLSYNSATVGQEQIEVLGNNSGYELGLIATKLANKVAVSSSLSFEQTANDIVNPYGNQALNYSLSIGKLMLPKKYVSYKQTNVNLMLEVLGQTNLASGRSYLDATPIIQFIFKSQARLDLGYRFQLANTMNRAAANGLYFNLYYTFFNAVK